MDYIIEDTNCRQNLSGGKTWKPALKLDSIVNDISTDGSMSRFFTLRQARTKHVTGKYVLPKNSALSLFTRSEWRTVLCSVHFDGSGTSAISWEYTVKAPNLYYSWDSATEQLPTYVLSAEWPGTCSSTNVKKMDTKIVYAFSEHSLVIAIAKQIVCVLKNSLL